MTQQHCVAYLVTAIGVTLCRLLVANENVEEALPGINKAEYSYSVPGFVKKAYVDNLGTPLPDDIFVASWPKSGTNWMKQLVHAIRIRGNPNQVEVDSQTDLTDIVPYLEADPNVVHGSLLKPRVYHVHLKYNDIPSGGRIIYVMRDLPDCAVSFYKYVQQFEGFLVDNTVDEVAKMMMAGVLYYGPWEEHINSFWEHRGREQDHMLFVKYEDMKKDMKGVITHVANFIGVSLTTAEFARVEELVSFEFMKKNAWRIQGPEWTKRVTGLAISNNFTLVNDGKGAQGSFSPDMQQTLKKYWRDKATPLFGTPSYESLMMPHQWESEEL